MTDATADPPRVTHEARTAPEPRPYRGPVFIGDAMTPLAGTTLLDLLWKAGER